MAFGGGSRLSRCSQIWKSCLLAAPVWLCTLVVAQTSTFVSFDAPDAGLGVGQGTHPLKINQNGVITGWYLDSHTVMHGFVRMANGQITEFDAPGASFTHPNDINSLGQIVGTTSTHAFLRLANGVFMKIAVPGAINTNAYGINDSGAITGVYSDSAGIWHGFLRDRSGTYTFFDAPDGGTHSAQGTTPIAINASGEIVGYYLDAASLYHGFVRDPSGTLTEFDAPGTWFGSTYPAINGNGEVIGNYSDVNYRSHAFLRDAAGNITTIDMPGATTTLAYGINDRGAVVGVVGKPHGGSTGFLRDSSGNFLVVSAPAPNNGTIPTSVNLKNITGWYYDTNNAIHGFVQ